MSGGFANAVHCLDCPFPLFPSSGVSYMNALELGSSITNSFDFSEGNKIL